jgi:hypothetical protein
LFQSLGARVRAAIVLQSAKSLKYYLS